MPYSKEILSRARARLAQARQEQQDTYDAHLQEAYVRYPRLREIDRALQNTMAQVVAASFRSGEDPTEAIAAIKEQNLALQQEREWILDASDLDPDFLDDSPICAKCGGTGYIGSTMCDCLRELCRSEQKKELSSLIGSGRERFSAFRLDYYPDRIDPKYGASPRTIMERNLKVCRTYGLTFTKDAGNLLFVGGTGLGKTFLSACIARAVADRGCSVVYESAGHLFSKLEQAKFSPSEDTRRETARFNDCDLLILDDLGTETPSQFTTAALYTLLNDRILENKPMVISTNLTIEELGRRYSPQIASRLNGNFLLLPFVGEDIRVMKNRGL